MAGIPDKTVIFRKFDLWWPLLTSIFTWAKKWPKWLRTGSLRAVDRRISRPSSIPSFRVRGGWLSHCRILPPPPWRRWLRPPPGRGLNRSFLHRRRHQIPISSLDAPDICCWELSPLWTCQCCQWLITVPLRLWLSVSRVWPSPVPRPVHSRTLTHVHEMILEDLVYPAEIVGKRIRIKLDGSRLIKVHLDKAQQTNIEHKVSDCGWGDGTEGTGRRKSVHWTSLRW